MAVPYTFGTATAAIPLSQLDSNFSTAITLGNTAVYLGNTTTSLGNVTLTNVTISSGNVTVSNVTANAVTSPAATNLLLQSAGTTAVTIDTSQNVGIGKSSAITNLDVLNNIMARPAATSGSGELIAAASDYLSLPSYINTALRQYGSTATGTFYGLTKASLGILEFVNTSAAVVATNGSTPIVFATTSAERMRIDSSGNLLVGGTTTRNGTRATIENAGNLLGLSCSSNTNAVDFAIFYANAGTICGAISRVGTTSAVVYTATSDYRLKENVHPFVNALDSVSKLKPCKFTWKDSGASANGFIAHELQEVCPDAVVGTKDAVDEDGNPKYQAIDQAKIVSLLTAAIQEQQALIQSLTDRLTALEAK